MANLDRDVVATKRGGANLWTFVGGDSTHDVGIGLCQQSLEAKDHLDVDHWRLIELALHVPVAIERLTPTWPIERDVRKCARGAAFAGEAVARLPHQVAEQHVRLKAFFEGLPFEKGVSESVTNGADRVEEHMIKHRAPRYSDRMSLVLAEIDAGVATITLNNPGERNTLTAAMVAEICSAMDRFEADESVHAIIVTGAAPSFCAGANLGNLAEATGESLKTIYEGFLRVARSPLPTIAAIGGAAVGAGMNLALCCDVRLAGESAKFDTRFMQVGLHPGGGHTWMMSRLIGTQASMATVVFGEVLGGKEAERHGLVWKCVQDAELMSTARALASRAAAAPRQLLIETKRTIQAMANVTSHDEAVERELITQVWSTRQPWFAERLAALQTKISKK